MTFFSEFSPNDLKPFFFGGIASCVAEAITFPIDTAKTRLQLQGMSYSAGKLVLPILGLHPRSLRVI